MSLPRKEMKQLLVVKRILGLFNRWVLTNRVFEKELLVKITILTRTIQESKWYQALVAAMHAHAM